MGVLVLGSAVVTGCGASAPATAAKASPTPAPAASTRPANQIDALDSYVFSPTKLTVKVGTEVTWLEVTRFTPHNVRLEGDPSNMTHDLTSYAASFHFTFAKPGTYHFVCTLHEDVAMVGDVVVES
jgi:plastocyanin